MPDICTLQTEKSKSVSRMPALGKGDGGGERGKGESFWELGMKFLLGKEKEEVEIGFYFGSNKIHGVSQSLNRREQFNNNLV